jgi:hypothetical protein
LFAFLSNIFGPVIIFKVIALFLQRKKKKKKRIFCVKYENISSLERKTEKASRDG